MHTYSGVTLGSSMIHPYHKTLGLQVSLHETQQYDTLNQSCTAMQWVQSLATCVSVGVVMKRNMLMCACLLSWLVCVVIVIRGLLLVDCCCSVKCVTGTTFSVHHVCGGGRKGKERQEYEQE